MYMMCVSYKSEEKDRRPSKNCIDPQVNHIRVQGDAVVVASLYHVRDILHKRIYGLCQHPIPQHSLPGLMLHANILVI